MIRCGIGGWTYAPWRGTFYPHGLPHARELAHASRQVTAIEINGTYYRNQTPATFRKWADEVPDGFVFALKAPRNAVGRRVLAEAGEAVERFMASGPTELGDRLGPILWQMPPTRRFDAADMAAFLALLPKTRGGRDLRHVLEVRHPSFACAEFLDLAAGHGVAVVCTDHADYPNLADVTAPFVYARLQRSIAEEPAGYSPTALDAWVTRARAWERGGAPADLPTVRADASPNEPVPRDVFIFFINGMKERAPHAAMALIGRLAHGG